MIVQPAVFMLENLSNTTLLESVDEQRVSGFYIAVISIPPSGSTLKPTNPWIFSIMPRYFLTMLKQNLN
jgi:hypothetical protein